MTSLDNALSGLVKSAAIVFLGSVVGKMLSLLGQVFIVRSLDPTTFGHVALAYTVISTVAGLALLGSHDGVTRLMSAEQTVQSHLRVLRAGYTFAFFGGSVLALTIYAVRFKLGIYLNNDQLPRLLVAFLPFIFAYPISRISFSALRVYRQSFAATVARDLGPRVGAILLFGVFALSGEAFWGAVVYWVATPTVMVLLTGYYLHREISVRHVVSRLPDQEILHELWSFSWPLAVGSSFFLLLSNVDILMIGYFMEPYSVGLYRAIQPLRQITTFVVLGFTFLFLPIATEFYQDGDFEALDRIYTISTKWVVVITFSPVLVFTLFASDVVRTLFGGDYVPAAPALAILTAGLFLRAVVGLNGDMARAIDRPRIELYSVTPAVVIDIVLNLILIPRYGITGAAAGTVIGYGVYNLIEVVAIYWTVEIHPFSTDSLKPLVPTFLFALALAQMTADIKLSLPLLILIGVLIAIVNLISIVLTRSLSREDLMLFEQIEKRTGINIQYIKSFIRNYY
ncbi:flippase [Halorubrum ezzemoulense]|uniref:flippase n=1 Tax=Halorubrum ezzemoulense TaxID=337243 RepID=UPI002330A6FE|nr:flippase [Halorubrum ezzemoulense]MDB9253336.1 flippase [Halorubrum ezzemoulense]MDB9256299.1 flippase [Halorubrum ezzemoulense]MDB9277653.1 flippase [Halorubrum ezzemoulense]